MATTQLEREFYTRDDVLLKELETYYSYVLDNANLNYSNPITANMCYFNNTGKVIVDGPKVGRTFVFITKPNMNFSSYENIQKARMFNYLTSSKMGTTLARMLMYPKIAGDINYGGYPEFSFSNLGLIKAPCGNGVVGGFPSERQSDGSVITHMSNESRIEDLGKSFKLSPTLFNTLLSNTCIETSNGKDITLETKETEGDYSGNRLQYAGGIDETTGPGEITLTFQDLYGSPVMNQIILWLYYMHYCSKGICNPYKSYIINRIIDYTCSIYVFMLDTDQRTIVRWTAYRGCFPRSVPFGQIMHAKEINMQQLENVQIPFAYNMACPMDPIVLNEFNMIAEPALLRRQNNTIAVNDEFPETAVDFFKGKNHWISLDEALAFKYYYQPDPKDRPEKAMKAYYNLQRQTNIVDDGEDKNQILLDRERNRFYGLNYDDSFLHPYIVDGNKLMFL